MNLKQISRFVKKVNNGVSLPVKYFYNSKLDSPCSQVRYYLDFYPKQCSVQAICRCIEINRSLKKHLKTVTLKSSLLHEVGHLYTGYYIKNKTLKIKSNPIREYEAHMWAIGRAKRLKMYAIEKRLFDGLREWRLFDKNDSTKIYKKAWKIAVKNGIINNKEK